ncbi:hypothetical protein MY10362_005429 [Beauveria mimosiformis]
MNAKSVSSKPICPPKPAGAGGQEDVAAERQRAGLRKGLDRVGIIQDEYEIRQLKANVSAKAGAGCGNGARGGPRAVGEARRPP